MSETAATIPLVLSIYFFRRDPFLAGFLLGVMFAVRFQTAFFVPGFLVLSLHEDWSSRQCRSGLTLRLTAGLTLSLFAAGLMDKLTWGSWFHSPIECFKANIVEGIATKYGVGPWYQYLDDGANFLSEALPLLGAVLLLIGAVREWRIALLGLLFFVGHSVIARKDDRFLWPLAPIVLLVIAAGFEIVYREFSNRWCRTIVVTILIGSFVFGSWSRFERLDWKLEPARSSSLALAKLRLFEDVSGVVVLNVPTAECGNYFYLRRDVPLLVNNSNFIEHPLWIQGRFNYIIAPKRPELSDCSLKEVESVHEYKIYKVTRNQK
jgi:hypothetical protein